MKALIFAVFLASITIISCSKEYRNSSSYDDRYISNQRLIVVQRDPKTGEVYYTEVEHDGLENYEDLVRRQTFSMKPVPSRSRIKSRYPESPEEGLYFVENANDFDSQNLGEYKNRSRIKSTHSSLYSSYYHYNNFRCDCSWNVGYWQYGNYCGNGNVNFNHYYPNKWQSYNTHYWYQPVWYYQYSYYYSSPAYYYEYYGYYYYFYLL